MSTLHYFQRYSQKENWLTNNTLLLLKHLNHYEHAKFQEFVESVDEQLEIHIGPTFRQQTRVGSSVPDGAIIQESFKILVEAKPHGNLNAGQLKGHAEGFEDGDANILLVLTKNPVDEKERKKHKEDVINSTEIESIAVVFKTYEELYNSVMEVLDDQDKELIELAEDYAAMCVEENLFEVKSHTMMAVSCGDSYDENIDYSIYYDPVERNHNLPFAYLGIYKYKRIRHIGKVEKIVACDLVENELVCTREDYRKDFDDLTKEEVERI
ncbi:MAG TPA: hypothetical protein DD671_09610, partial [Balneolaceae bacterium]|nr:hypothetical protein [Balneolaceae bacterium]